ncbi:unnamed protein product [Prunus armeniaca]|uniref:Nuclear factor related to kappa-B-binding protein second winged helix domain-containing protein n=1 Tax=Prunus armeniaca TaxID=36596 RepID=A0A6J5VAI5_PRUAR|nr:unnamed protein product [Prunus armeniaca]
METGSHGTMRKVKNGGLKVLWAEQLRSMKNEFKRDHHHPSWQMAIQSHIDATHALVQLANEDPSLLHGGLHSHGMKHSVKGIPSIKDSKGMSRGDSHSDVAGRKVNFLVKRQKADFGGCMKDEDAAAVLDFHLPAVPYPAGRKQKKMKMFKKLSSLVPKYMKSNVSEKDDNVNEPCQLLDSRGHDRLRMLMAKKRKRVAGSYSKRKTVEVAAPVNLPLKRQGFKLPVPTVHTGFSFSIVHLLTAIRRAMVDPHAEDDDVVYGNAQGVSNAEGIIRFYSLKDKGISNSVLTNSKSLPSLTLNKIVERVRSTPMDPSILQTQEPLQDLLRGVLEIFSSKTAPLGARGWKPLAFYRKSSKCWSWIGPINVNSCNADEEYVSSKAWSLHHNVLVKLVDSFAIWYKSFQERIRQVGSLPAPPLILMQPTLDESEWFRDIMSRKNAISPNSEEVRAYFQREEALRYLVPDMAFSYTALDGRKSAVAPLTSCSGKPSCRNRDHFMLKADRPPHITNLCLVRDAASRLPGSIGTRENVSTLVRHSQYIVEDVSDEQLTHVIRSALSRLQYEFDPCVEFDRHRKLWVYLHGERGEEDFLEDGTLSTLRRRRHRDMSLSNLSVHETALQNGQEETCMLSAEGNNLDVNVDTLLSGDRK